MPLTVGELRPREGKQLVQVMLVSRKCQRRDGPKLGGFLFSALLFTCSYWVVLELGFGNKIKPYPFFESQPLRYVKAALTSCQLISRPSISLFQTGSIRILSKILEVTFIGRILAKGACWAMKCYFLHLSLVSLHSIYYKTTFKTNTSSYFWDPARIL